MPLLSTWVLIAATFLIPADVGPAAPEELAVCELPKGSFVDPLPEVDDCAPEMSHEQTNDCLDELQDEVEALARNQAALEAQARCLCETLQRVAGDGDEDSSPYDLEAHRCSFDRP